MIRLACIACLLAAPVASLAQTLAVKGSDGAVVGFYTGPGVTEPGNQEIGNVRVVSSTGYSTVFLARSGEVNAGQFGHSADGGSIQASIVFRSTICEGQAFVFFNTQSTTVFASGRIPMPGAVLRGGGPPGTYNLWYVPKNVQPFVAGAQASQFVATLAGDQCQINSPVIPPYIMYEVFPNNPGVTGIPNVPFVPPLTIEPVPVSAVFSIFRDSFESPQASIAREGLIDAALAESRYT